MKIKIGFFAILLGLALLWEHSLFSLSAALAVIFHETGHMITAAACGIRLRECKIGIYGAGLIPENGLYSYQKEILLCLSGPLVNLICGSCLLPIGFKSGSDFLRGFVFSSFSLGILNLLPICGFDGGRIINAILCLILSPDTASRILKGCSFLVIFFLWIGSVYLILRVNSSLSFFIFSISLFGKLFISDQ